MQPLRKVGIDTGLLRDEELRFIDAEIIEAAVPELRAREVFELEMLPNAGIRKVYRYTESDMGQALITMNGDDFSMDRTQLTEGTVSVPVISKDFSLNWRDLLAARYNNMPLELSQARNAARQVAEEENKLLITGEYAGWPALGIEGLATATGRNTQASAGAWPANAIADLNAALGKLEEDGHTRGPYVLVSRVVWARRLDALISGTTTSYRKAILDNGIIQGVIADDSLFTSGGATTNALVVEAGRRNFSAKVGQDITTFEYQLENMNKLMRVFEVITPNIKRPTSICELTGLS